MPTDYIDLLYWFEPFCEHCKCYSNRLHIISLKGVNCYILRPGRNEPGLSGQDDGLAQLGQLG